MLRKIIQNTTIYTNKFETKEETFSQRNRVGVICWIFLLSILDKRIMHTEEFILIPKRMFLSHQSVKNEILENPIYEQKRISTITISKKSV